MVRRIPGRVSKLSRSESKRNYLFVSCEIHYYQHDKVDKYERSSEMERRTNREFAT